MHVQSIIPYSIKKTIYTCKWKLIIIFIITLGCKMYSKEMNRNNPIFTHAVDLMLIALILLGEFLDGVKSLINFISHDFIESIINKNLLDLCGNLPLYSDVDLSTLRHHVSITITNIFVILPIAILMAILSIYQLHTDNKSRKTTIIVFSVAVLMGIIDLILINAYQNNEHNPDRRLHDITKNMFILKREKKTQEAYTVYTKYEQKSNDVKWYNKYCWIGATIVKIIIFGIGLLLLNTLCNFHTWYDMISMFIFLGILQGILSTIYNISQSWMNAEHQWSIIHNKLQNIPESHHVPSFKNIHLKLQEYFTSSVKENLSIDDKLPRALKEQPLLKNIEFEIRNNQSILIWQNDEVYDLTFKCPLIIVLKGESGKGKTTLLKLLTGVIQNEYVQINENKINNIVSKDLGRILNYVDQSSLLIKSMTLKENFELMNVDVENCLQMCEKLGLNLRDKVHEILQNIHFSGGEYRRLYLAIALCKKCDALIMDEPCASMDPQRQEQINEILKEKNYKFIISTEHLGKIGDNIANLRLTVNNTLSYAIKNDNNEWIDIKEGEFPACSIKKITQKE